MSKVFDLQERTAVFGEEIIRFLKSIQKDILNDVIIRQLLRSGTSVGANYCEADCAESKKDFEHKLGICKKEAKETRYWLRMLKVAHPQGHQIIDKLAQEAKELQLIFITIIKNSKEKKFKNFTS